MRKSLSFASLLLLAATGANAENVHVDVRNSDGSKGVDLVQVQYVTSQFYNLDSTRNGGQLNADLQMAANTQYSLKFTYKGTTYTTPKFTAKAPGATVDGLPYVNNISINLAKLVVTTTGVSGENVNGLTPTYVGVGGSYYNMPATVDGQSCIELLPSQTPTTTMKVRVSSTGTISDKYCTLTEGANTVVPFVLTKVTLAGAYLLGGSSWYTANGLYVFPGTFTVRTGTETGNLLVENTDITKKAVMVRLVNSKGQPISGAGVSFYENGWVAAAPTSATGGSVVLTETDPASLYTQVSYLGATQIKYAEFAGNTVQYRTNNYKVSFMNSVGEDLVPASLEYYANGWKTFDVNPNTGTSEKELLPYDYYFQLGYKGAIQTQYLTKDKSAIEFKTRNYVVNFNSSDNKPLDATSLNYYANGWKPFTPTNNGVAKMELLPYSYFFELGYGGMTEQKYVTETESPIVNYFTKEVAINVKDCDSNYKAEASNPQYYANGWKVFGPMSNGRATRELLPGNYYFNVELNGTNQQVYQTVVNYDLSPVKNMSVNYVVTQANAVWPSHQIKSAQFYSSTGWRAMNIHGSSADLYVLPGSYYFLVDGIQMYKAVAGCSTQLKIAKDGSSWTRLASEIAEFSIFPNPATDVINVTMPEAGIVSIFSIDGRNVATHTLTAGANRVDISSLITGTYVLVNGKETIKFVKH